MVTRHDEKRLRARNVGAQFFRGYHGTRLAPGSGTVRCMASLRCWHGGCSWVFTPAWKKTTRIWSYELCEISDPDDEERDRNQDRERTAKLLPTLYALPAVSR